MSEINRGEIWVPGRDMGLNGEYPVPPIEELQSYWEQYLGSNEDVIAAPGVYGVVRIPKERPTAYASVDLCEVVRQTSEALRAVEGEPSTPTECTHCYAKDLSIDRDIVSVVQTLMANDVVPPVEGIDRIAAIMQSWHEAGVYVFANTSTLPGCELGTIRFLEEHLPGVFDGLLLPRNHDGSLPVTKGIAACNLLQLFGEGSYGPTTAIHIDDLGHHNIGFREALSELPDVQTVTFQPIYPSDHLTPDAESIPSATPLEAFEQANAFLATQLQKIK